MAAHTLTPDAFDRRLKPGHGLIAACSKIAATFREQADATRTRARLAQLTDRQLDDIGLCRADLQRIGRF
ncbi:hypothetical protein AYJ57_21825 (plasmid) [Salipiger sp. CCB-MM3]|uniref:DUF1127 domain-containing protein n=1 Tax=Salipiger sp. CCB-MM3 TaxID=1792508 RepID=UPI00080AA876|nr:DUF1127 domain-containing protein [Salipiger sp. CCB-MM3]ANT63111.1 hypothetical protein AYJ57_21825 [Salipiger sp. CCB-MM3]